MTEVRRVKLPGVGVLHSFYAEGGGKVGVIAHRTGHSDLVTFSEAQDGHEATKVSLRLNEDEAHTLAELLGGTRITESRSAIEQIPGLAIDWFTIDYDDYVAGQALGAPADHGFVGVTVVAVVRGDSSNPGPGPDFKVFPGDTLILAGSPERVAKAFGWFRCGPNQPGTSSMDLTSVGATRGGGPSAGASTGAPTPHSRVLADAPPGA